MTAPAGAARRAPLGATLRILEPAPHVLAFYDGRVPGVRLHADAENWLDDGAYALGICSYAVIDGGEALVYDTHVSLPHARLIRQALEARGARHIRVALSHWHDDHVAGNAVFADCEIIANRETDALLRANRARLEAADPPIRPLVLPNRLFEERLALTVGAVPVELIHMDIHSRDGTVALLPDGLLLAGDTLEDPVTYVDEPERLAFHRRALSRLAALGATRILPNHGAEEVIAVGGYGEGLIAATGLYIDRLLELKDAPAPGPLDPRALDPRALDLRALDLRAFAAAAFATGAITYFAPYEAVHRRNVAAVLAARDAPAVTHP